MIEAPNSDIDNRVEYEFADARTQPSTITCLAGGEEMLRIGPEGFWVRGVKVEHDEREAQAVYNAFKQWMAWMSLGKV